MKDCVFCKIVKKEIPKEIEKETDSLLVFKDVKPQAPGHLLIVPKMHIKDISETDDDLWAEIKNLALEIKKGENLNDFRLVTNYGNAALVPHMHVHFLSNISAERKI